MTTETKITATLPGNVTIVANQAQYTSTGRRSTVRTTVTDHNTGIEKLAYTNGRRLSAKTVVDRISKAIMNGELQVAGIDFYYDFEKALRSA